MKKESRRLKRLKEGGFLDFLKVYGINGAEKEKILSKEKYLKQLEPIFNTFKEELQL